MLDAPKSALKHSELTEKIIGSFFSVYNELGPRFLESVYQRSMIVALGEAGLRAEPETPIQVWFHGQTVGDFRADIIVEGTVLLEIKTARQIDPSHEAQVLHYLRATQFEVGMMLNFGAKAQFRRYILENERKKSAESAKSAVSSQA